MEFAEFAASAHSLTLFVAAIVSLIALVRGADWLVEGAASIAVRLGLPPIVVGATVVSLGTTSPECAVSVLAAWSGQPGLALGNAVGSVIADTGLIFGLCVLLADIPADRYLLARQGRVQFGAGLLFAALCYLAYFRAGSEATLGMSVGILLIALLFVYLAFSVKWGRERQANDAGEQTELLEDQPSLGRAIGLAILGLVFVVISSQLLVDSVAELALRFGVPDVVVAATLVALGTSLPELMVGLTAVRKGHLDIVLGNVIGADVLNILFVVGASALAADLPLIDPSASVPDVFLRIHIPTMLITLGLFRLFVVRAVRTGTFGQWMGVPLVLLYVLYTFVQFGISRG